MTNEIIFFNNNPVQCCKLLDNDCPCFLGLASADSYFNLDPSSSSKDKKKKKKKNKKKA